MAFLLSDLKRRYVSIRGYHTSRRLIVIESDDWGSIRMPSRAVFEKLQRLGDTPERDAFLSNDCLESRQDLESLFQVLRSVRDKGGGLRSSRPILPQQTRILTESIPKRGFTIAKAFWIPIGAITRQTMSFPA